jgi:ribosomal protein S18 acetylase RimI-like enzyme
MTDRREIASGATFAIVDPAAPEARAAFDRYFAYLDAVFDSGFDPGDVERDLASYRAPDGAFVLATIEHVTVACGAAQTIGPGIGEIKRMWVHEAWRGAGLGRRMVAELERIIGEMGHHTVRLDTNRTLTPAIGLYEGLGYHAIDRYNDNPYAHHWFEKRLT